MDTLLAPSPLKKLLQLPLLIAPPPPFFFQINLNSLLFMHFASSNQILLIDLRHFFKALLIFDLIFGKF